jgi:hypothetical protein
MRLANYSQALDRNIRNAHKRAGNELRDDVKQLLNVPGFQIRQKGEIGTVGFVVRKGTKIEAVGLKFRKNEINYDVVRSKPGEPPRRQRGTLWMSMTFETRDTPRGVTTRVGPSVRVAKYARALELGHAPGGLAPRPYLAPAANAYSPQFQALIADAIRRSKP